MRSFADKACRKKKSVQELSCSLRDCLHGDVGPRVGEVIRQRVKSKAPFHAILERPQSLIPSRYFLCGRGCSLRRIKEREAFLAFCYCMTRQSTWSGVVCSRRVRDLVCCRGCRLTYRSVDFWSSLDKYPSSIGGRVSADHQSTVGQTVGGTFGGWVIGSVSV